MASIRRRPHFPPTAATDAQTPLLQPVHELAALTLRPITAAGASRLWNEYVARYHYLGYTPLSGSQLRYNVFCGERLVALLSFGASAWKLAGRDRFIGWQEPQRLKNLQLVVNNARFLIPPWIQSKGLASKILALVARQLPHHWHQRYGYRPVLLETFVESVRHRGTCYKAANWVHVGQTVGRGKKCPVHQQIVPIKDIWLYPPPVQGLRQRAVPVASRYGFTEYLLEISVIKAQFGHPRLWQVTDAGRRRITFRFLPPTSHLPSGRE